MLNTTGSLIGAQRSGILPCVTYTAGVSGECLTVVHVSTGDNFSGSCWALSVLYSGVAGSHDARDAAEHIKSRLQTSYLDTVTLDALTTPPTNKVRYALCLHVSFQTYILTPFDSICL